MELVTAFRGHFYRDAPAVSAYTQDRVYKWHLKDHVDQKGTRALVVLTDGGWTTPVDQRTQQFPTLVLECWADCSRIVEGGEPREKAAQDAIDNAFALFRVADAELHPMPRGRRWGAFGSDPGLLVIGGQRWAEPRWHDAERPDGSGRKFGDAAMVRAEYALQVVTERASA